MIAGANAATTQAFMGLCQRVEQVFLGEAVAEQELLALIGDGLDDFFLHGGAGGEVLLALAQFVQVGEDQQHPLGLGGGLFPLGGAFKRADCLGRFAGRPEQSSGLESHGHIGRFGLEDLASQFERLLFAANRHVDGQQ